MFWIEREQFDRLVHVDNYLCRSEQHVYTDAYLDQWFLPAGGNHRRFWVPVVYFWKARLLFINGRHRTAVLFAHQARIPMAVAEEVISPEQLDDFPRAQLTPIKPSAQIELPDLPIFTKEQLQSRVDRTLPRIPTPNPLPWTE